MKEDTISLITEKVNSLLGITLTDKDIEDQLDKLDFKYTLDGDTFEVTIPRRRLDIENNVNDIVEEIGRLYGYHNLKNTLPVLPTKEGKYEECLKAREALDNFEVDIEIRKIPISMLENIEFTPAQLAAIDFMIEEEEEHD